MRHTDGQKDHEIVALVRTMSKRWSDRAQDVDDIAQEAMLRALQSPPRHEGNLKSWCRTVVRSRIADQRRTEQRLSVRARDLRSSSHSPSAHQVAAMQELRALLHAHVSDLAEPRRQVLRMRYFEGLPPRKIARSLGLSVETVKGHLKRGLAELRVRLESCRDSRMAILALLPAIDGVPTRLLANSPGRAGAKWRLSAASVTVMLAISLPVGLVVTGSFVWDRLSRPRAPLFSLEAQRPMILAADATEPSVIAELRDGSEALRAEDPRYLEEDRADIPSWMLTAQRVDKFTPAGISSRSGQSVAVDGDWRAIGANAVGRVYMQRRLEGRWVDQPPLRPVEGVQGEAFGDAVSIDGGWLAVGVCRADREGLSDVGAVDLFQLVGSSWEFRQRLYPDRVTGEQHDNFGHRVCLSGDILAVGGCFLDGESEATYLEVFRHTDEGWARSDLLRPEDDSAKVFGSSVAIGHGWIAVGDFRASPHRSKGTDRRMESLEESGQVTIYHESGGRWIMSQVLVGPREHKTAFGCALDADRDRLIVGAHRKDGSFYDEGAAFVYRDTGTTFECEGELTLADPLESSCAGVSVSLDGSWAVLGAPNDAAKGAAFVFRKIGGEWVEFGRIAAHDGAEGDSFGWATSLEGRTVVVGAHCHWSDGVHQTGAAYTYRLPGLDPEVSWEGGTRVITIAGGQPGSTAALHLTEIGGERIRSLIAIEAFDPAGRCRFTLAPELDHDPIEVCAIGASTHTSVDTSGPVRLAPINLP